MRTTVPVLITALTLAAVPVFAQTTSQPATRNSAAASARSKSSPKPTTVRATGKLSTFDASSRMLTLTGSKGDQQFTLADSTRIQQGSKKIDMVTLGKLTGQTATVSYVESSGQRTVQSVRVAAAKRTPVKKG